MSYKIKSKKIPQLNKNSMRAKNLKFNYYELENKSQEIYGTRFMDLPVKEQDEISRIVARGFHYKIS